MKRLVLLLTLACASHAQTAPTVAFTFDDLPAHGPLPPGMKRPEPIHSILATLKSEHMPPAYGYINGYRVTQFPYQARLLQEWRDAGQPLGSHTYSHPSLDETSAKEYIADIARNEPFLKKLYPHTADAVIWHSFRYPYLQEGDTTAKRKQVRDYLLSHNYKIAEVSLDFEDSLWNEPYARCMTKRAAGRKEAANLAWLETSYLGTADEFIKVFRGLSQKLYGRDIRYVLLLHVGAFDAKMLPRLIALFRERGFTFTTLDAAQQDPAYDVDPGLGHPEGGTFLELIAEIKKVNFPDDTKPYKRLDSMCR